MKRLRRICIAIATVLMAVVALSGCMVIQAQKMKKVKGTYALTTCTRTSGKTNKVTNYIEEYGYEEYLIVTGENQGYFVHKDNQTPAYSRKVFLTYTYDEEQTSKVARVNYTFVSGEEGNDMGVTANGLNYSKPRIYINDSFNTDGYDVNWRKVDDATDLSYAKGQLGAIREYDWGEYEVEGVYSASAPYWENNVSGVEEAPVNPYAYYLIELDAVAKSARIAYLRTETGSVEVKETKPITLVNGWNEFKIGDETFVKSAGWSDRYEVVRPAEGAQDGSTVKYDFSMVRANIGDDVLEEVITEEHPVGIYSIEKVEWDSNLTGTDAEPENPYVYYFIVIDPLTEKGTVTVTYLKKAEGSVPVTEVKTYMSINDWSSINLGDIIWYREYANPANFYATVKVEGDTTGSKVRYGLSRITKEIGAETLAQLIAEKTPAPEVTE